MLDVLRGVERGLERMRKGHVPVGGRDRGGQITMVVDFSCTKIPINLQKYPTGSGLHSSWQT